MSAFHLADGLHIDQNTRAIVTVDAEGWVNIDFENRIDADDQWKRGGGTSGALKKITIHGDS